MIFLEMKMSIISEKNHWFELLIQSGDDQATIWYSTELKLLRFPTSTEAFHHFLETHQYQLNKLLRNKRLDTYYVGFELTFILWKDKDVTAFNDKEKLVVVDRRDGGYQCYTIDKQDANRMDELYIDGSYLEEKKKGGYAILHKDCSGEYHLHKYKSKEKGSNRIELIAAIEALKLFNHLEQVRIITDSQYVRKGLSEWLLFWERNDFTTANGEQAKNIDLWKEAETLLCNRYVELEWVKAHKDHFENTLVDLYARDSAEGLGFLKRHKSHRNH